MKNQYRFLALMTSFVMVCAAPMSALCSEAAPAGETAAAAEQYAKNRGIPCVAISMQ